MRSAGKLVLYLSSVLLISCAPLPRLSPTTAGAWDDLYRANQELAAQAQIGFVAALSDAIAPTGIYVAAVRDPGRGPEAARAFLLRDTLNARSRASWRVVRCDVSADGRDGYSYGYLDLIRANGDTLPGAFKSYWRRQPDGKWKIIAVGRGRRDPGSTETLPLAMRPAESTYRRWPMRDTVEGWNLLKATEIAFSDSSATSQRDAFMSFAAPDAGKIQGKAYVFGKSDIGEEFRNPPPGFAGIEWHAEWGTVAASNDLGFNIGPVTRRGAAQQSGGAFFTIWRRQPNGEWKYVVD